MEAPTEPDRRAKPRHIRTLASISGPQSSTGQHLQPSMLPSTPPSGRSGWS